MNSPSPRQPPSPGGRDSIWQHAKSIVASIQHAATTALGVDELARTDTVVTMLENNRRRAPGYWIQLTLAMGIATIGLVLNSTAVVIGAMLVSPLMGPIIELGMGFAVGSALLTLRAFLRVALSVVVVIAGAALLTVGLPFHDVTPEIAARTAPTALDLLVAIFCALTAAYTTVRPASDTTSAAAGTAIGIALVPPLCVTGFGIGTGSFAVAAGASLLFTANLSAILVLAVLSFLTLGYNQVDAKTIEQDFVGPDTTRTGRLATGAQNALRDAFGSRYGMAMRVIVPAVFLASVYLPLRRALGEVTWEVRARDAIRRVLTRDAPRAVQTSISVERHTADLHLVFIGSNDEAAALESDLSTKIAAATGVVPTIAITAVPDAKTLAAASLNRVTTTEAVEAANIDVATIRQRVSAAIAADWLSLAADTLAGWDLVIPSRATPAVLLYHTGDSLGDAALALLASNWSTRVGARIQVRDVPVPRQPVRGRLGREAEWLAAADPILEWVAKADGSVACVKAPIDSTRRTNAAQRSTVASVRSSAAAAAGRVTIADSAGWSIRLAIGRCAPR